MAENSGIEWTDHTFNPWIGCTKISPACDHCYAEVWDNRFNGNRWGAHADRKITKTWGNPPRWNRFCKTAGTREKVFVASLADVFDNHKSIKPEWRDQLWRLIEQCQNLDFLLLTKRPQNIKKLCPWTYGTFPSNVWTGATIEHQKAADQTLWHLCQTPSPVRFISAEPLIGPLNLTRIKTGIDGEEFNALTGEIFHEGSHEVHSYTHKLDWVIAGGESGTNYRHADPDWFRSIRDQCDAAGVPFLFKQWEGRNQIEIRAKGRKLDGVIHDGYPKIGSE